MNKKLIKDISWYVLGSFVPIMIGLLRSPIFTRHFTPEEYGMYGLIMVIFNFISIALFSWLSSCIWRFYNQYKSEAKAPNLFSNIAIIFVISTLVNFLICATWAVFIDNQLIFKLVVFSGIFIMTNELISLFLIIIRLEDRSLEFSLIKSLQAIMSFSFLVIMAFGFNIRIESIILGYIFANGLICFYLLIRYIPALNMQLSSFSRKVMKELIQFGSVGLVSNLCIISLSLGDRIIIKYLDGFESLGIYNQTYNISQVSIFALVTIFFNVITPKLNKLLSENKELDHSKDLNNYFKAFILSILPLTIYFSLFSEEIVFFLLGKEFRVGYAMIPFIMSGAFIYGLLQFNEMRLKFSSKYSRVIIGYLIATALNIVLNLVFISLFDYFWAAKSTFISYLLLFFIFYLMDKPGLFLNRSNTILMIKIAIIIGLQIGIDFVFRKYILQINPYWTIIEGLVFLGSYIIILKNEIKKSISSF